MGNFRRDNRGDSRDRRSSMHKATCSECGDSCEVPFKPTGSKPVFCSDCFEKQDSKPRRNDGRKPRHFDRGDKQMFKTTCSECGDSCEVPFKPTGSKPVFCSECFDAMGGKGGSGSSNKQFEILNDKLDEILRALKPALQKEASVEKKDEKPEKKTAEKKKAATPKKTTTKKKTVAKKAPAKKLTKKKVATKKTATKKK